MARTRTTITLDQELLKAVKIRAARQGLREGQVIEQALRDALLISPLERMWDKTAAQPPLTDDEAMELALEAQTWAREQRAKDRSGTEQRDAP